MKYISALLFLCFISVQSFSQNPSLDGFLDGKSVVLISVAPGAKPTLSLDSLAREIHGPLIASGGDPVGYYELENITLSEGIQAGYAAQFSQRLIKNIIIITRKENAEMFLHMLPFTQDKNIVSPGTFWSTSAKNLEEFKDQIAALGKGRKSKNLLVIEVPEFYPGASGAEISKSATPFLSKNPLNLDVFKLGVSLSGSSGEAGYLTTFRYDLLGKSPEQVAQEQQTERVGLESIFNSHYPFELEFLTTSQTEEALIKDRVQYVLMRLEGREGDLMKSMGVEIPESIDKDRIVVKYYIKFLIRNELYIGPVWDADPDWEKALINFLKNLQT